jgi:hypothetical protein
MPLFAAVFYNFCINSMLPQAKETINYSEREKRFSLFGRSAYFNIYFCIESVVQFKNISGVTI